MWPLKVRVNMRAKLLAVGLIAAFLIVSLPVVVATHDNGNDEDNPWTASGTIVAHPPGLPGPESPCDEGSAVVLGEVVALPAGADDDDHHFEFRVTDAAGADVYFHDANNDCEQVGSVTGQTTLCCHTLGGRLGNGYVAQTGDVPDNATHAAVDYGGLYGSGPGNWKLTIPVEVPGCEQTPFC